MMIADCIHLLYRQCEGCCCTERCGSASAVICMPLFPVALFVMHIWFGQGWQEAYPRLKLV